MRIRRAIATLSIGLLMAWPGAAGMPANAQDYPARTITLIMPYPPGGGTDYVGRLIAQRLEQRLGQTIVLEYRPGAASAIAATYVSRQPADGYTILYATSTTMAINVSVHKKLNYDPAKDLAPIALIAVTPFVLVVNPSLPIHSVADIVKLAREKAGGLTYASNGPGGAAHLFAELASAMLGIKLTHIPYKGNAPALNDVVAGHVALMFVDPSAAIQLARQGKLRALGVSTAKRVSIAPELSPLAEAGLPGYDASSWHMLVAPGATPKPILAKLNTALTAIVQDPAAGNELAKRGFVPTTGGSPDELAMFVKSEIERWGKVVRRAGAAGIE
jgi:tripartite-type tricarboxylate transporter receptor subunit TctC